MISTVIVTYNEGRKLQDCLKSVAKSSGEIIVVDLGSDDESVRIAKDFNVKIFHHAKVAYVEKIRNFALSKTEGDWILVLDPDERVTDDLWKKLREVMLENKFAAINIPRKNIFFGRWIKHSNWWPDRHIRFFKKGIVSWNDKIHSYPKVEGKILDLQAKENLAIVHFGYNSIDQFLARQNRYSSIEAENLYETGVRFSWGSFFWKPVREFLVRFIRHAGFLDGFYGFALTFLMMIYQLSVVIKLWEMEKRK